jgi:hypothetical protein
VFWSKSPRLYCCAWSAANTHTYQHKHAMLSWLAGAPKVRKLADLLFGLRLVSRRSATEPTCTPSLSDHLVHYIPGGCQPYTCSASASHTSASADIVQGMAIQESRSKQQPCQGLLEWESLNYMPDIHSCCPQFRFTAWCQRLA